MTTNPQKRGKSQISNQTMNEITKSLGSENRNAYLDLLRAVAIALVVVYHVLLSSPVPLHGVMRLADTGRYGVDLFFMLSGWLIGGLYWKEHFRFGNVELLRFWLRRWIRTIPPYLVALLLAWLAVFIQRRQPFSWGYLLFAQNYFSSIEYFRVSWSLCIEEHFYLFLPLLLLLVIQRGNAAVVLFSALLIIPLIGRWWESCHGASFGFGYATTATHLRMEPLVLGFLLARVPLNHPVRWTAIKSWAAAVAVLALVLFLFLQFAAPPVWMYRLGFTALALGLAALLIWLVEQDAGKLASSTVVKAIALTSYSVYLTHALVIDAVGMLMHRFSGLPWLAYFPIALLLITVTGATFYFAIELTSVRLRDRWVPRRARTDQAVAATSEAALPFPRQG